MNPANIAFVVNAHLIQGHLKFNRRYTTQTDDNRSTIVITLFLFNCRSQMGRGLLGVP